MTTVVIPAHNEGRVIERLLRQLVPAPSMSELNVIVVANGCNDDTAMTAAAYGPCVRVLSIPVASKHAAVVAADAVAKDFPRIYVDADVELSDHDIRALTTALLQPGVLAAAPERVLDVQGRPWTVRWYYDVWTRLPEAQRALWGRGVIAVNGAGQHRIAQLPPLLADDLAASLSFSPGEQVIVADAHVTIHAPRTLRDLLRRKIRSATGIAQLKTNAAAPYAGPRTRLPELVAIASGEARMIPRVALFLAIVFFARLRATWIVMRGDFSTWLRDDSSRK
jgi:glycosyltransferase involved in cell wall biosynthesis